MKIICTQKDLVEGINIVQKAVSLKTTLPILKGILIEAGDNYLKLTGNDLNLGIETKIQAKVEEKGSVVVSSRLFGDIIRKLPDEDITLISDDKHHVLIECKQSSFDLLGQSPVEFPELPVVEDTEHFSLNQDMLRGMIRQTIFAASQDEARPVLTGVLMEVDAGEMSMVAIDGYRLALRKASIGPVVQKRAVIPAKTLSELSRLMTGNGTDAVEIFMTDKHILFESEEIRIVSRLLEGEFIKYSQIIPKESKSIITVQTMDLNDAIERASLLAREGKNSSIRFTIKDELMTIRSNVEIGSVKEELTIYLEGDDIEIGFNPRYLLDSLKVMDSDEITLEMTTPVSPCVIKPKNSESYLYLVLPVRMAGN